MLRAIAAKCKPRRQTGWTTRRSLSPQSLLDRVDHGFRRHQILARGGAVGLDGVDAPAVLEQRDDFVLDLGREVLQQPLDLLPVLRACLRCSLGGGYGFRLRAGAHLAPGAAVPRYLQHHRGRAVRAGREVEQKPVRRAHRVIELVGEQGLPGWGGCQGPADIEGDWTPRLPRELLVEERVLVCGRAAQAVRVQQRLALRRVLLLLIASTSALTKACACGSAGRAVSGIARNSTAATICVAWRVMGVIVAQSNVANG